MALGINGLVRLTEAASVKIFGERMVINMRLITNNRVKRGENWVEEPVSIDATHWVHKNSKLAEFLGKGQQVYVAGHLEQQTWEKEGIKHYKLAAVLDAVELAGGKPAGTATATANTNAKAETPASNSASASSQKEPVVDINEDEIPF